MDVAGVEAERDPPVGSVQHACSPLDRPVPGESRPVELQGFRRDVGARLVERGPTGRRKVLSLLVAEVRLGRAQVRPIGLSLDAIGSDRDQVVTDALASGLPQQLLNDPFALFVLTFAELVMPDSSLRVRDVHRGPVPVAESTPDRIVAVERDRIPDPHVLCGLAHVVDVALERELGRVDANNDQPPVAVLLGPRADVSQRAEPVDAGVRPEIDDNDLLTDVRRGERRRIEPTGRPVETGQVTLDGQRSRPCVPEHAEQAHFAPPTSMTAWAKASGASWRRLCPIPPSIVRCEYLPENFLA